MSKDLDITSSLEASPNAVMLCIGPIQDGVVSYVNRQFELLTGYSQSELYGHDHRCLDLDPPTVDHKGLIRVLETQMILCKSGAVLSVYRIKEDITLPDDQKASACFFISLDHRLTKTRSSLRQHPTN